jgi:hypothetical protein
MPSAADVELRDGGLASRGRHAFVTVAAAGRGRSAAAPLQGKWLGGDDA